MKKNFTFGLVLLVAFGSIYAQTTYNLEYKYKKGDIIKYKTERHDSTESNNRGQSMDFKMTSWMLQSLNIKDIDKNGKFVLVLKTDSTWSDNDQMNGRFRRINRKRDLEITINKKGNTKSENPPQTLLFLNLPEKPVAVNDKWDYELHGKTRGRRAGETTTKNHCVLYGVEKQGTDDVAVIIVNTESESTGKFSFNRQGVSASGTFSSSGDGSALVYFNITKGIIQEIVAETDAESSTESSAFSSSMLSKSKVTTKLISE